MGRTENFHTLGARNPQLRISPPDMQCIRETAQLSCELNVLRLICLCSPSTIASASAETARWIAAFPIEYLNDGDRAWLWMGDWFSAAMPNGTKPVGMLGWYPTTETHWIAGMPRHRFQREIDRIYGYYKNN